MQRGGASATGSLGVGRAGAAQHRPPAWRPWDCARSAVPGAVPGGGPGGGAAPESLARPVPILEELGGMYLADPTGDAGPRQDDDDRLVLRFLSEFGNPGTPVSHVNRDHCR